MEVIQKYRGPQNEYNDIKNAATNKRLEEIQQTYEGYLHELKMCVALFGWLALYNWRNFGGL